MDRLLRPALVVALLCLAGCSDEQPASAPPVQHVYNIAPKDMVGVVKQAIAAEPLKLTVVEDQGAVVTTDWRDGYQGNFHIARYWQERTRFRIAVIPDFQNPQSQCRIEVTEVTEERSNPRGDWRHNSDTTRPERCAQVVAQIDSHVPAGVIASSPALTSVAVAPAAVPAVAPIAAPSHSVAATAAPAALAPLAPADWVNGSGRFTTTLSVADAGQRIDAVIKAMQLEIKQSKLTAIDGTMTVQGATGPEIGIVIQAETSGVTLVTVSQLDSTKAISANGPLIFSRLQQELTK